MPAPKIVQLIGRNEEPFYPVTSGEAIEMAGGKNLDQLFNEKTSALQTNYEQKSTALQSDYTSKVSALQTDYNNKKTALENTVNNKVNELNTWKTNFEASSGNYRQQTTFDDGSNTIGVSYSADAVIQLAGSAIGKLYVTRVAGKVRYSGSQMTSSHTVTVKTPTDGTYLVLARSTVTFPSPNGGGPKTLDIPTGTHGPGTEFSTAEQIILGTYSSTRESAFDFNVVMVRIA